MSFTTESSPAFQNASLLSISALLVTYVLLVCRYIAGILAVVANTATVFAVIKFENLRTPTNFCIVSLAVADVLSGFVPFINTIARMIDISPIKATLCLVKDLFSRLSNNGNLFSILWITLERSVYLMYPMKYIAFVNNIRVTTGLLITWFSLTAVTLFSLVYDNRIDNRGAEGCTFINYMNHTLYFIVVIGPVTVRKQQKAIAALVPKIQLGIIHDITDTDCKTGETHSASQQPRSITHLSENRGQMHDPQLSRDIDTSENSEEMFSAKQPIDIVAKHGENLNKKPSKRKIHIPSQHKITKMMVAVLGVYFCCNTPAYISATMLYMKPTTILFQITIWCTIFFKIQNFINPFIYAWKSADFRKVFKKMLKIKTDELIH